MAQPAKRIACYGASNTYGFDPRSFLGERYDETTRWPEVLAVRTGWTVFNWGENGREIPHSPAEFKLLESLIATAEPLDLLVLDLGANDLLRSYPPSVEAVTVRLETLLRCLERDFPDLPLLVLAPGPLDIPEPQLAALSRQLGPACMELSRRLGVECLDTGAWELELSYDGIHLSPAGHRRMAWELAARLG
ncbi:MAG: GDSL-type esterase/lipase family protein [Oscillospiraceae bacterium]|nr:GDSL-type esterase/lipase family protein [Oscillospiraceae bacterium]